MFTPLARTRRQESNSVMSKITQTHNYVSFALSRAYAHIDKSYRLFAVTSVTDYRQKATYQPLTRSIHNYFGIKFSLLLSPRCFIKGKLLRYFRYSASITYFRTLLSPSISRPCILSLYQTLTGVAVKTNFTTPPSTIPFSTSTSVLIANLSLYSPPM